MSQLIVTENFRKEGSANVEQEEYDAEVPMEDLVPRTDIAPKLTKELCDRLKAGNWNIRNERLDEVKDIVSSAKFITGDLVPLPASLAPSTTDANKILAMQAIELIGRCSDIINIFTLIIDTVDQLLHNSDHVLGSAALALDSH